MATCRSLVAAALIGVVFVVILLLSARNADALPVSTDPVSVEPAVTLGDAVGDATLAVTGVATGRATPRRLCRCQKAQIKL